MWQLQLRQHQNRLNQYDHRSQFVLPPRIERSLAQRHIQIDAMRLLLPLFSAYTLIQDSVAPNYL
jgi:hypothetical protein